MVQEDVERSIVQEDEETSVELGCSSMVQEDKKEAFCESLKHGFYSVLCVVHHWNPYRLTQIYVNHWKAMTSSEQ
jgi:hypothetical protein